MAAWTLHWLEAEGTLAPWRSRIEGELAAAEAALARVLPVPRLDVIVQRLPGFVIPEIGMVGHAFRRRCLTLTLDPDNMAFAAAIDDGAMQRMMVHEVHHCLRMAAVGYGRTLGEALVSEGLAGRFTAQVLNSGPEPWERAVDAATLERLAPGSDALAATGYDHDAWFFGTAPDRLPRWLGYTMGYAVVGRWISASNPTAATMVDVAAADVLAAGLQTP